MGIMAEALKKVATKGSPLGEMISDTVEKSKRERLKAQAKEEEAIRLFQEKQKRAEAERTLERELRNYVSRILNTEKKGYKDLQPCTLVEWKPGKAALTDGKRCRIKWALCNEKQKMVVISYEYPQPFEGSQKLMVSVDMVSVDSLAPCDCLGYIHKYGCAPPKQKR